MQLSMDAFLIPKETPDNEPVQVAPDFTWTTILSTSEGLWIFHPLNLYSIFLGWP